MARTIDREEIPAAHPRRRTLARIVDAGLASHDNGHPRAVNLRAIQRFIDGDADCAWNFKDSSRFLFGDVLAMIASVTGCSPDAKKDDVAGYISPHTTLDGIEEAGVRLSAVARGGGQVLLATGHPGSLLTFYDGIPELVDRWGGRIMRPARGEPVQPKHFVDYVGSVAVMTDYAGLLHTHDHQAMRVLLSAGDRIDLVVADHGYAGAAIEAGLPVISVMDTNDPVLAVWKYAGADLTIIPIDDNRPSNTYSVVVELLDMFGNGGRIR